MQPGWTDFLILRTSRVFSLIVVHTIWFKRATAECKMQNKNMGGKKQKDSYFKKNIVAMAGGILTRFISKGETKPKLKIIFQQTLTRP